MKNSNSDSKKKCLHGGYDQIQILFYLMILGCFLASGIVSGQVVKSFGPGVAGQVYSLAYDPDDPSIIYAGGDMHGVFKTVNGGEDWVVINNGLQNDDCNETFYIMDIIVLGDFHQIPESRKGVYAATAGGVFFRAKNSSLWVLQTNYELDSKYEYFGGSSVENQGNGIPFSSFAFCQESGILYAGTGSTRLLTNACSTYEVYPQHNSDFPGYSIWVLDVINEGSSWDYDVASRDLKMVKQVAVVVRDSGALDDVVFASCGGIYRKNHATGGWEEIFSDGSKSLPVLARSWSDYPTGVAGGSDGYLYCISKNSDEKLGGVFEIDLSNANAVWRLVGGDQLEDNIFPHTGFTVQNFFEDKLRLLGTLTVIPGINHNDDQVFVGVRAGKKDGYFRFGQNSNSNSPSWIHFLLRTIASDDRVDYQFVDYGAASILPPEVITPSGWLENYSIFSTTPLAYYPQNSDFMFAMNYHLPVGTEDGGELWEQWNCDGSVSSGWKSNGINLMHTYDFAFSPDGKMWLGSRDFGLFEEGAEGSKQFFWRDRSATGIKRAMALQEVEGRVYVLRMGPRRGWNNNSTTFGYRHYVLDQSEGQYSWEPNAETVLAYSDPLIEDQVDGDDGYGWRFITRGLDDVFTGVGDGYHYNINGFLMAGVDTCFVACTEQNTAPTYIYKRVLSEGETWSLVSTIPSLWSESGRTFIKKIPKSNSILVGAGGFRQAGNDGNSCGLYCVDTRLTNGVPIPWVTSSIFQGGLSDYSCRVSSVEISGEGDFLYVGTHGNFEVEGEVEIGSILRLFTPRNFLSSPPLVGDWDVIANFDAENTFFSGHEKPHFWYPEYTGDGALEAGYRLSHVDGIAIDPRNSKTIYVALGGPYIPYLHPRFGAWKMDSQGDWTQLSGASEGDPYKGATAIEINPFNNFELLIGTQGAECFSVGISPSVNPKIYPTAEYKLLTGQESTTVFAVKVTHPEGLPLTQVTLDATTIGLGNDIPLFDDGLGQDDIEGDNIFSSGSLAISQPLGTAEVSVFAQASDFGYVREPVQIEIIEALIFKFADGSGETGELGELSGQPYSAVIFSPILDDPKEYMMVSKDDQSTAPELFEISIVTNGIPVFDNINELAFGQFTPPPPGSRGLHYADFDNDGDQDLFVCNNGDETTLYLFEAGSYNNATSTIFTDGNGNSFTSLLEGAHVAAWGDYNQDGWIDLFVATMDYENPIHEFTQSTALMDPNQTRYLLFKGDGEHLVHVPSGLIASGVSPTISASWNDVNQDGLIDLVMTHLVRNTNSVEVCFNNGFEPALDDFWLSYHTDADKIDGVFAQSMNWIDYNNDQYLDLVVTQLKGFNGGRILVNTGNGFLLNYFTLGEDQWWDGAVVGDFDNSGTSEIVLLPYSGIPELYKKNEAAPTGYIEMGASLGLRSGGVSSAALATNFNADRDLDLYLGRGNASPFMYINAGTDGQIDPGTETNNSWIGLNLICRNPFTGVFTTVPGAQVKVVAGADTYYQMVDGGSARGGQNPSTLHFGFGSYSGTVDVYVNWPNGIFSAHTNLSLNVIHTLEEETLPIPATESEMFAFEPCPGGGDAIFTWVTPVRGYEEHDAVQVDFGSTNSCSSTYTGLVVFDQNNPDVEVLITPHPDGGWQHKLIWHFQGCVSSYTCTFTYQVKSQPGSNTWGIENSFRGLNVCVSTKYIPHQ